MPHRIRVATRAALAAAVVVLVAQPALAQEQSGSPVRHRTTYEDLQMFSQVLNQIRVNHPDSIDSHDLFMAAVEGMIRAADPHSYVIPAARMSPEKEKAWEDGKLYPVPLSFEFIGGSPVLVSIAPRSSAASQDLLIGDELIAVDGKPVDAESGDELDLALSGPKKSTVKLTFERQRSDGSRVQLDRVVKRERIEEESAVVGGSMLDSTTGYLRITTFMNDKVAGDMHDELGRLDKLGMKRLVLDLRDNGGGSVSQAAEVAGEFLPKGTVVYTSEGRKAEMTDTGRVKRSFWRSEAQYPLVLMVNGGTASASELVAGALQDHDRALIVGRPTFGKSLLMVGLPLTDGSLIELVVGHIKTPCGRVIQRQYRGISTREYYRLARADRDTAGRPSCKTDAGRTVYGGGGIYPDVRLAEQPGTPLWLARLGEGDVILKWAGAYLSSATDVPTLDALASTGALPATALASFRAFAKQQGETIPDGADIDARLQLALVRTVARVKYGEDGYYRVAAALDPAVKQAVTSFDKASSLLGGNH